MIANKKLVILLGTLVTISTIIYGWFTFATDHSVLRQLHKLPQNTLFFLNPKQKITVSLKDQEKLTHTFLKYYFSPWQQPVPTETFVNIKKTLEIDINKFKAKPGVGTNTHDYDKSWVANLEQNSDLNHFPNHNQDAITTRDTNIRILPTTDPSFSNMAIVSKSYPFDNLQHTFIPLGTPIHIIHVSKDKAWFLVLASSFSGWIQDEDVAFVSKKFKDTWQGGRYAVSTQDNIPLFDEKRRLATKTRIGVLYPISHSTKKDFTILIPGKGSWDEAVSKPVVVNRAFLTEFPIPISSQNIAEVANNLIGKPYGWGGIYGYRDSSSTLKDLMATFGIWLPRNPDAQIEVGEVISLSGLSDRKKEKVIIKQGIPFLTLIHRPGHVVLYIGQKQRHPIVFHSMWSLPIYKLFSEKDRIIIGQTVITPLNFSGKFINASLNHLKAADSMILLCKTYYPLATMN